MRLESRFALFLVGLAQTLTYRKCNQKPGFCQRESFGRGFWPVCVGLMLLLVVAGCRFGNPLPPTPAPLARVRGMYRYQVVARGKQIRALTAAIRETIKSIKLPKDAHVVVDIDPMAVL